MLLTFLLLVAGIVVWLTLSKRGQQGGEPPPGAAAPPPSGPLGRTAQLLDAVPTGALLVATIDVRALRRTPIGERLIGRGRQIAGLGSVSEVCGNDPMAAVEQLALAIPGQPAHADFAVFAAGQLDADAILTCAKTVISKRGGLPVVASSGRFRVLRDAKNEGGPELAIAAGGPAVLGEGAYLQSCIDVAEARLPSVADDPAHVALRRAVGDGVVVATVVLTPQLRATLTQELAAQGAPESPAAALVGAGVSLALGAGVSIHAALRCAAEPACADLARLLAQARQEQARALGSQSAALMDLLQSVTLRVAETTIHAQVTADAAQVSALLDEVAAPKQIPDDAGEPDGAPAAPAGAGGGRAPRGEATPPGADAATFP